VTTTELPDPTSLSLDDLRRLRQQLQLEDDAVSYARRVAQTRLDLLQAEAIHRADQSTELVVGDQLRTVLSSQLTGGPARPPRPIADFSGHPLAVELDELCASHGLGHLKSLDDLQLVALTESIAAFEARVSLDRRERFDRLDALSAELVRRYRDGEAHVDSLPD
jgi:hypothetical protein